MGFSEHSRTSCTLRSLCRSRPLAKTPTLMTPFRARGGAGGSSFFSLENKSEAHLDYLLNNFFFFKCYFSNVFFFYKSDHSEIDSGIPMLQGIIKEVAYLFLVFKSQQLINSVIYISRDNLNSSTFSSIKDSYQIHTRCFVTSNYNCQHHAKWSSVKIINMFIYVIS